MSCSRLARRLHVAEGVEHLGGRVDLLELHAGDAHAGAVEVEDLLDVLLRLVLDLGARRGADHLEVAAPDDLAERGFGGVLHRPVGAADVEDEIADADRGLAHLPALGELSAARSPPPAPSPGCR